MPDSQIQDMLQKQAGSLGLSLTSEILVQMSQFCETLLSWNQKMHLVSKKDARPDRIARQMVDSLLLLHHFKIPENSRVLDLGSGAGFPAVPLKIARPDLEMVLTESTLKKCDYLQNLLTELNLSEVTIFSDRARHLPKNRHGYFDFATAKASGLLSKVWQEIYPFLKRRGLLLTYKGQKVKEEIRHAGKIFKELPGRVEKIIPIDIKELDLGGSLISVRKL